MFRPTTRPPASREVDKWDEFERKLGQMDEDDEEMKQEVRRDPWAIAAVVVSIFANFVTIAIWGGRQDERMSNSEKHQSLQDGQIQALQAKGEIDAAQNTQIAVLSTQLGQIQSTVSEIKVAVSREKQK